MNAKLAIAAAAAAGGLVWLELRDGDDGPPPELFGRVRDAAAGLLAGVGLLGQGAAAIVEGSEYHRGLFDVALTCSDDITPAFRRSVFNVASGQCKGTIYKDVQPGQLGKEGVDRWESSVCCQQATDAFARWKHAIGAGFLE